MSLVKFFTTFLLGAAFAYIVSASGSIYVTMVLHFLNNAFSMVTLKYPEVVSRILPFIAKEQLSVAEAAGLLVIGGAGVLLGVILLRRRAQGAQTI